MEHRNVEENERYCRSVELYDFQFLLMILMIMVIRRLPQVEWSGTCDNRLKKYYEDQLDSIKLVILFVSLTIVTILSFWLNQRLNLGSVRMLVEDITTWDYWVDNMCRVSQEM
jgi:hypothetical protein